MSQGVVPTDWLDGCVDGHRRLENRLAAADGEAVRRPSRLPGWTVGHLLTHLARNADAHTWMVQQAGIGEAAVMYPGGPASRDAAIQAGSGRPAEELVSDVVSANRRLEEAWSRVSHETWADGMGMRTSGPATVADLVFLRWREVEVHQGDLGLPGSVQPWDVLPAAYLDREWAEMTAGLADRLPAGTGIILMPGDRPSRAYGRAAEVAATVRVRGTAGRLLAWLMDRDGDADGSWPVLRPWAY